MRGVGNRLGRDGKDKKGMRRAQEEQVRDGKLQTGTGQDTVSVFGQNQYSDNCSVLNMLKTGLNATG